MSFITTKFHVILLSGFSGVVLMNCFELLTLLPEKKLNKNFLWICPSTHYVLHNYKVSRNSVERFQWSCADKKTGLTD